MVKTEALNVITIETEASTITFRITDSVAAAVLKSVLPGVVPNSTPVQRAEASAGLNDISDALNDVASSTTSSRASVPAVPDDDSSSDESDSDGSDDGAPGPKVCHSTNYVRADGAHVKGPGWIGENRYQARGSGRVYDTTKPPPQVCWNCDKPGHWRTDCPYPLRAGRRCVA
jgi:Zinc knuckle